MTGKVVGFIKGMSKAGNPYAVAFVTYKDPKFTGLGEKCAECFVRDDLRMTIDETKVIGAKCELGGSYDKNGNWRTYLNSVG